MKEKIKNGDFTPPMLGKTHSKEVKEKARKRMFGKSFEELYGIEKAKKIKEEASIRFSGENNPFYGKNHSIETLKRMSEIQKIKTRKGKESNFYGKKYWPERKLFEYKGIKYRSNWEVNTAKYFESKGINFEYEAKIFELDGCTYTPDFYLINDDKFIEIKGYWYEDAINKFEKFKQKYNNIEIEVWDTIKLQLLNII